jgi:hypothetical protein
MRTPAVLADSDFLGPFARFAGIFGLVTLAGIMAAALAALVLLAPAVINRLRWRYQEFLKGFKDVVRATQ